MAIAKITVGNPAASGANMEYILRENAVENILLKNLDDLQGETKWEQKVNCIAHAYCSQDREINLSSKARTHYRMVLSWEREESPEKVAEMSKQFVDKVLPKAKAVIAVHNDTDHIHSHVWIDARQTDGKKVHMGGKQFYSIGEKWADLYDREYGTNYLPEFKAKKRETLKWKKEMAVWRKQKEELEKAGEIEKLPPKPAKPQRSGDTFNTRYWREKEIEELGGIGNNEQEKSGTGYRNAEGVNQVAGNTEPASAGAEFVVKKTERNDGGAVEQDRTAVPESRTDFELSQRVGNSNAENETKHTSYSNQNIPYLPRNTYPAEKPDTPELSEKRFSQNGFRGNKNTGANFVEYYQKMFRGVEELRRVTAIEPIEMPEVEINKSQILVNDLIGMLDKHLEKQQQTITTRTRELFVLSTEYLESLSPSSEQIDKMEANGEKTANLTQLDTTHQMLSEGDDELRSSYFDDRIAKCERMEIAEFKEKELEMERDLDRGWSR